MGNICAQEVGLQLKVCFLYLGNVFVLKMCIRFKDGVRFKEVGSL